MEQQTNSILTATDFAEYFEPGIIERLSQGKYEEAMQLLVDILQSHSMEPELRVELLFAIACCQYEIALQIQNQQYEKGKSLAQLLGITQVEAATVKGMVAEWVTAKIMKAKGEQNG